MTRPRFVAREGSFMRPTAKRRSRCGSQRRGSDAGVLVLRVVTGGLRFGHATQNLFGWFGQSRRPPEVEQFRDLGYRPAAFFARFAGLAELAGSISLVTGAATPIGGALTARSAQAIRSAKWQNGPWDQDGGYEYLLLLGTTGASLAFMGPGRYSADAQQGLDHSGLVAGIASAATAAISLVLAHRLPGWSSRG